MSTHATKVEALNQFRSGSAARLQTDAGKNSSASILRQVTAGYIDTAMAARQACWNVRGGESGKWQERFETAYIDIDSHADTIAGRLVALGYVPPGTVQVVTTTTSMVPFPNEMREDADLIEALMMRLGQLASLTRRAIAEFERLDDPITIHHLTEAAATVEKQLWIIEGHSRPN